MNLTFLNNKQRKELQAKLEKFGILELPRHLIQTGKEKIRAFSGEISGEEIMNIWNNIHVEGIGLNLLNVSDDEPRISLDGLHLLKPTKRIIQLNKEQSEQWFKGQDLQIDSEKGYLVLKFNEDIIGMGKSNGSKIINFLPKERRIKN
jgi:NOL1/NOP2/fmu family ribosome biogenesis protein